MSPSVRLVSTASSAARRVVEHRDDEVQRRQRRRQPDDAGRGRAGRAAAGARRTRAPPSAAGARALVRAAAASISRPHAYSAPVSRMSFSVPCRSPSLARSIFGDGISAQRHELLRRRHAGDQRVLLRAVGEVRLRLRREHLAHELQRLRLVLRRGEHADAGDVDERAEVLRREVDLDRIVGILGLRLGDVVVVDQAEVDLALGDRVADRDVGVVDLRRRWRPCPPATASRRPRPRRGAAR